ncbi:MAG: FAD-dependent oxidoreductase [Bifidobacteriaceae bacterium]|jgi:hypothetical protein|nr:FAD-dependent oxidoreductase [Bifidobacteriaceae bacterium]
MRLFARQPGPPQAAEWIGRFHHTDGIGRLVDSLYAAGRAEYRDGPDDPAPGVPSITAVIPQLDLRSLDQVVELDEDNHWVVVQGRCRLDRLNLFLAGQNLVLADRLAVGQPVPQTPGPLPESGTGRSGGASPTSQTAQTIPSGRTPPVPPPARTGRAKPVTVGAGVIAGTVTAVWVDLLVRSGRLVRRGQTELPPDGLIIAALLPTAPAVPGLGPDRA